MNNPMRIPAGFHYRASISDLKSTFHNGNEGENPIDGVQAQNQRLRQSLDHCLRAGTVSAVSAPIPSET
jgi:hypothetical protein